VPFNPTKNRERKKELARQPDPTASARAEVVLEARRLRLPLKHSGGSIDVVVAEARPALHKEILEALESNLSLGWSGPYQALTVAFEKAFANYAGAILKGVAADVQAKDAQECLTKLRGEITEGILQWLEPSEERFEDELQPRLTDLTPDGEWEQRLEEAYQMFRPQHPLGGLADLDAADFRLTFEYRLRYQRHRAPFEAKLKSVLQRAIIEVEPVVREKFPAKMDVAQLQSQRRRGFPARADEHRRVLAALERFGEEWPDHLPEICRELEGEVPFPKSWRRKGVSNWEDVAGELEGGPSILRNPVLDYIQYRIRWAKKNG
jgi:hypothetical protein